MQIDGVREFFAKITSLNVASDRQNNTLLSAFAPQKQNAQDSLLLSGIGKRLSLSVNASETPAPADNEEAAITDPTLKLMDQSMAQAEEILNRIHELSVLAQDKTLFSLDRAEIQIEIEDLRLNFEAMPMSLLSQAEGGPAIARLPELITLPDDYRMTRGNESSMLSRMRTRIKNGQEWDVREVFSPGGFSRTAYNNDGEAELVEIGSAGWHVVDDNQTILRQERLDGELVDRDTGKKVPTVRERLEAQTPFVVMDAESAAESAAFAERQIESVKKWRERIAELSASEQAGEPSSEAITEMLYEVYRYLKTEMTSSSLASPDMAGYFYFDGKVYDQYPISSVKKDDDGVDMFLGAAGYGAEKNNNAAASDSPYHAAKLNEAKLEGAVASNGPEIRYIQGL